MVAWGLMERITPFILATNQSRSPKSVRSVMSPVGCATLELLELDLHHFVFDHLDRRFHFHEIADTLADQGLADRRLDRNAVEFHVGLVLPDERVLTFGLRLLLDDQNRSPEDDRIGHSTRDLDDPRVGQLRFDFVNARLDKAL